MIVLFFKSDVLGLDKFHVNARVKLNNIIYFSHPCSAQSKVSSRIFCLLNTKLFSSAKIEYFSIIICTIFSQKLMGQGKIHILLIESTTCGFGKFMKIHFIMTMIFSRLGQTQDTKKSLASTPMTPTVQDRLRTNIPSRQNNFL